jgi:hypothetical protein
MSAAADIATERFVGYNSAPTEVTEQLPPGFFEFLLPLHTGLRRGSKS